MKIDKAIADADLMRPNAMNQEQKAKIVHELDCRIAEMMDKEQPAFEFPQNTELLMKDPYDSVYPRYLCAIIDLYNNDAQLYANDMALFNNIMADAEAWWIRNHKPKGTKGWVTL